LAIAGGLNNYILAKGQALNKAKKMIVAILINGYKS